MLEWQNTQRRHYYTFRWYVEMYNIFLALCHADMAIGMNHSFHAVIVTWESHSSTMSSAVTNVMFGITIRPLN